MKVKVIMYEYSFDSHGTKSESMVEKSKWNTKIFSTPKAK